MTRKTDAEIYAAEQAERLNAIGLTEDVIAENENRAWPETPAHRVFPSYAEAFPSALPLHKVLEYARIDAFCDAVEDRLPSPSHRFVEARLHMMNMQWLRDYTLEYERCYRAKKEAA